MGGVDLAEALGQDVQRILSESRTEPVVRKKAALCLLRLFRSSPDTLELSEWADKISSLLEDRHLGVVTSVMSLLLGLATASPETYEGLVPYAIHILTRLVVHKACNTEYLYYSTPSPWLQVKCLKFLELYRPPEDATQLSRLNEVCRCSKSIVWSHHRFITGSAQDD
jgi:AP-2 complex subunit alpha